MINGMKWFNGRQGPSVRNSPLQSANAEGFAEACLCFLVSASAKKIPRQLNFKILKYFYNMYYLIKKKKLLFFTRFSILIFLIIHRCLYSLFILLLFSYISFYATGLRKNASPFLSIQVAKVQQTEWKNKSGRSECGRWICNWAN